MLADPKTVRVRAKVLVNGDGQYAAYGFADADEGTIDDVLSSMMDDHDTFTARSYWLVADIPLPQTVEIEAEDRAHAAELRRACEHPYPAPRILA
jgi:hypothetical protein